MQIPEWAWRLSYIVNWSVLKLIFLVTDVKKTNIYKEYFEKEGLTFETSKKFYTERALKTKKDAFWIVYSSILILILFLVVIISFISMILY